MSLPTADNAIIRAGRQGEVAHLTAVVVAAYIDLPISHWLAPNSRLRQGTLLGYWRLIVGHVLAHGHVQVIDGPRAPLAVAGWLSATALPTPPGHAEQVAAAAGDWADRFQTLDAERARVRALGHRQLMFFAALPHVQNHGLGTTLLAHHVAHLDERGISAALETASPRSVQLFARHGFAPHGTPITVGGGPGRTLTPMRRSPQPPADSTALRNGVPKPRHP